MILATIQTGTQSLRFIDLSVVIIYLMVLVGVAVYFTRRIASTEHYFVGGRSLPGWAVGLSMLGSIVSSATFIALPAAAFILDWRQLSVNFMLPVAAVFAVMVFIPFFRRGHLTSAFEYLGMRYGRIPRLYGTLSFMVLQLIRMAQILFLVSLPIQFLTGAPSFVVIVGMGILVALYTIVGGIEAVIWADVLQALILIVGGILCFTLIAADLPGGISQIIEVGQQHDKFSLGSFDWNVNERTFWTVLILGFVNWITIYSGDQNMVQRYAAARSTREARKAALIFSVTSLPMWTMFFFVGTALFVFYTVLPDPGMTALEPDQILPYFVLTRMPVGVAGIIVAAIIAAAMSSLDSGINAVATVTVVDLIKPHIKKIRDDNYYLRVARIVSAVVACVVIAGAMSFRFIEKESMNDLSLIVASVFGGCLMGLFLMGFFTRRVDGAAATTALACAMSLNVYLVLGSLKILPTSCTIPVHTYWIGALVNLTFITLAYLISLINRKPQKELKNLTIWTLEKGIE